MLGASIMKRARLADAVSAPTGPPILYYAGQMGNGSTSATTSEDPVCVFTDSRQGVILEDARDYVAAFVRLQINGTTYLPAFRPVIQSSQPDPDLTIYSVTSGLTWRGCITPPASIAFGAAAADRTFFISATLPDGSPAMTPLACILAGGAPIAPAALPAAVTAAINATLAVTPTTPWGGAFAGAITLVANRLQFDFTLGPARGVLIFNSPTLSYASASQCASTLGVRRARVEFSPTSPIWVAPNYPNGTATNVVTSPALTAQTYIRWIPEDSSDPTPPLPPSLRGADLTTNPVYYNGYTCSHVGSLFNTAIATSAAAVQSAFLAWWATQSATPAPDLLAADAPVLEYDSGSKQFSVSAPAAGYGPFRTSAGLAGPFGDEAWELAFNTAGFNLFSSFPSTAFPITGTGRDVALDFSGAPRPAAPVGGGIPPLGPAIRLSQDYASTDAFWSPVAAIAVQSIFLNAGRQLRAPPLELGTSNVGTSSSSSSTFDTTIVDFTASGTAATDARTIVTYVPDANYRFLKLGPGAIQSIDIKVGWVDRLTGDFVPLRLPPQASATFVIAFFHETMV